MKRPQLTAWLNKTFFYLRLSLALLLLNGGAAQAAGERTYSIGVVPQFEARQIHNTWNPILDELKQRTGYNFELTGSPSIPEFEKQLDAGFFDFAYMNPYHMVIAHNKQGYVPLLRDTGTGLNGILVVKKGGIKQVSELNGKTIAFPSPNALGASLMMRADLSDKFRLDYRPTYVKSHSSVYPNVLPGLIAAGGCIQKTLNQQSPQIREGLEIIHQTGSITSHPIAAHPRVDSNIQQQVQQTFLDLARTSKGKTTLGQVPIKELGTATISDYNSIAKLGLERFYVQE